MPDQITALEEQGAQRDRDRQIQKQESVPDQITALEEQEHRGMGWTLMQREGMQNKGQKRVWTPCEAQSPDAQHYFHVSLNEGYSSR